MKAEARIAEIQELLVYVTQRWPVERERVASQLARRCSRCILTEQDGDLSEGLCRECLAPTVDAAADAAADDGEQDLAHELGQLLSSCQGKAEGPHDALLMFSGGKDSSLLLHRLRAEYPGLRLLTLMVDNGFTSSVAMENVHRVSSIVDDVDHLIIKPKASLFRNVFRHALTHLGPEGSCFSVDRLGGDLALDIARNTAALRGIPLVIHGGTRAQVQKMLGVYSYETPRSQERQKREAIDHFVLGDMCDADELAYFWDGTAWPEARIPRVIFPFYAWHYDELSVRREVVRLGLVKEGNDNPIASNSELLPVNMAVDILQLGRSSYEAEFSQLIREGKTSRAHWLPLFEAVEYLARRGELLPGCISHTLGKLQLTHQELGLPLPPAGGRDAQAGVSPR